jgi:sporulation protein YlmC with PRC-barrel domain
MKHSFLASTVIAWSCLGFAAPLLAAEAPATGMANRPSSVAHKVANNGFAAKPAMKCLSDLRAFDSQMEKGGYWLGASGFGYGFPVGGYGYGYPMGAGYPAATAYQNARPGYEVRILIAAANILAQTGKQQQCEDVLNTTRGVYKRYVADLHNGGVPAADVPGWRNQQIAAAQPVTGKNTSFRSDELLGTEVRNAQNEALGSVDDIVMSPKTGEIAYLVIARGGLFGIDEKHVPVPWHDFKIAPNVNLLVLDATKASMDTAPRVNNDRFAKPDQFGQQSAKVDAYWKTHLSTKENNGSNG